MSYKEIIDLAKSHNGWQSKEDVTDFVFFRIDVVAFVEKLIQQRVQFAVGYSTETLYVFIMVKR